MQERRPAFDWFDARMRLLLQAAPDAMVIVDSTGKIVLANSQTQLLFGFAEQELTGEPIEMLIPDTYREAHAAHRTSFSHQPRVRQMGSGLELYGLRKDGRQFPVEISLSPLNIEGTRFVTAAIRDITGRKKTEEELRKLNAELHAKIAELAAVKLGANLDTADAKSPEGRLRQMQKMEAVGQLASGVAHDFNNILGVISGYAELLQERLGDSSEDLRMATEIRGAVKRGAALTSQLLAFGRKQVVVQVVLDPNIVCREMERMLTRVIGEDIELVTELHEVPRVRIDRGQLEQVLLNFAVNGRDAMPQGGRLKIATRIAHLDETYAQSHPEVSPGHYVELSVGDTGVGMDETTRLHLFEPFFTTKEVGRGTGLGLATVYGIVKQSNGHVSVYSEVNRGTVFNVYLPATDEPVTDHKEAVPGPPRMGNETILLAEDEAQLRTVTKMYLETRGYKVLAANNGKEAVRILDAAEPEIALLITDVVMPELSGRALAEQVLAHRPQTKVLYMSGYTDDAMLRHGFEQGRFPFLRKPFSLQELAGKVREVLDAK
jgi:hypothetical protein